MLPTLPNFPASQFLHRFQLRAFLKGSQCNSEGSTMALTLWQLSCAGEAMLKTSDRFCSDLLYQDLE